MTGGATPRWREITSAIWRIALLLAVLGACITASVAILPDAPPSDRVSLVLRIAAGLALSAVTLALVTLLVHRVDRGHLTDAGITTIRTGWHLALWGALVWTIPAAASFSILALLGTPLRLTTNLSDLTWTLLLLPLAVLVSEAIPEEAVFRGYLITVLGRVQRGWWIVLTQATLFTLVAGALRQSWNPMELSLFFSMGIAFGYLRMLTGSIWMPIGFHTAFQTGAQLVLTHTAVDFAGDTGTAMLALGVVPFTVAAIVVTTVGMPRIAAAPSNSSR